MEIKTFEKSDLISLSDIQPEGWSDITPQFIFYTNSSTCFPIKVIINKQIVGVGTSIIHNEIAWLAHIIVHPNYRNKGIGHTITQYLVDDLNAKKIKTIFLIATDLGLPVYTKVGFEVETEYLFFKDINIKLEENKLSESIISYNESLNEQIIKLDYEISGEDRFFQLEKHLDSGYIYQKNNKIEGFYLPSFGEGLIIASNEEAGIELVKLRLHDKSDASFPADNITTTEFFHTHNYREFKRAKRMCYGEHRKWQPKNIYNRIGGNLG